MRSYGARGNKTHRQAIPRSISAEIEHRATALAGRAKGKPDYYRTDKNNFAPRAAVAWTPRFRSGLLGLAGTRGGQTVLRGSYMLTYFLEGVVHVVRTTP